MSAQITQQDRAAVATHLRQWSLTRNVPQIQIDRMINDLLAGHHDEQIQRAAAASHPPSTEQQPPIASPVPTFSFQTPFRTFLVPQTLAPVAMSHVPPLSSVPAVIASNQRPSLTFLSTVPAPVTLVARTTGPGRLESIQHSTSYSGQQGNMSFSYSSSSTSTAFPAYVHHVIRPTPMVSPMHALRPAPSIAPAPIPLAPAIQPTLQILPPPRIVTAAPVPSQAPSLPVPGLQVPSTNNAALPQAPQNPRLAQAFGQQLRQQTYFSSPPGLPDRSVRR